MRNVKAVIFDLDGTLFDVRELVYKQLKIITHEFNGQEATRDQIASVLYGSIAVQIENLIHDKKHHKAAYERGLELVLADRGKALPYDKVADTLNLIKSFQRQMGVLTAREPSQLNDKHFIGIHHFFETVVHAKRVENHKPHPEGLFLAMQELGVNPENTVMVGDTTADICAGRAAGVMTIGVTHGFGKMADLQDAGADHIIHDIPSLIGVLNLK
ncbi:MAG TPA: HAD family hydrolase [Candidatus Saccharimonadales bacterium]|nr:HAD family hydrolase [Candidatus Saccharimonadales bacterium]